MTRYRRILATLGVGALLLGTIGADTAPTTGEGRAETQLQLLRLALSDVPGVGDLDNSLGTLTSAASTVDTSAAGLLLRGAEAAGTPVAERRIASDGPDRTGGATIPLGDLGSLSLVDWLVEADASSATAQLAALTGQLDTGVLGSDLLVGLGQRGVGSRVTEDAAQGLTTVEVEGIGLAVGDLLPGGLLAELPLGLILDLLDQLPIALDGDLADDLAGLDDVLADLEELLDLEEAIDGGLGELLTLLDADDLAGATASLDDLEADVAALTAQLEPLQDAVDAAEDAVAALELEASNLVAERTDAQADLDSLDSLDLTGLLDLAATYDADCDGLLSTLLTRACVETAITGFVDDIEGQLATVEAALVDAEADLADAVATLDAASEELLPLTELLEQGTVLLDDLLELVDELEALLGELTEQLGTLPDPGELRDDLAGMLADTPLFDLGDLTIEVAVGADAEGGSSSVDCEVGDLAVLGQERRSELGCDALEGSFTAIEAVLGDLLSALPTAAPIDLPAVVSIGGLDVTTATDAPQDGGENTGSAQVSALRTSVGSLGLDAVDDLLTLELGDLLGDATDALGDLVDLGLLDAGAPPAGVASTSPAEAAALDPLTDLLGTLDELPLGDGLEGLRTLGVDLEVADIEALSGFTPAQADDPGTTDPDPDDPAASDPDPDDPAATDPDEPQPTGSGTSTTPTGTQLPRTGGGLSLLGVGLLLVATVPRLGRA